MKRSLLVTLFSAALSAAPSVVSAASYDVDPMHSQVGFSVTHLMVSKVHGRFNDFKGSFEYDPKDPKTWKVEATAAAKSIDTGIAKRDDHLRSADFFDAEKFPELKFKSTSVSKGKGGYYDLKGDLTMRGVTKPVTFKLTPKGKLEDKSKQWGGNRVGFNATATVKRSEFGLLWNKALETGGVAVSDEVQIELDVEGVAKAGEPAKAVKQEKKKA